jgi:hypothetical protein
MSIHPTTDVECRLICEQPPVRNIHVQLHSSAYDACICDSHTEHAQWQSHIKLEVCTGPGLVLDPTRHEGRAWQHRQCSGPGRVRAWFKS